MPMDMNQMQAMMAQMHAQNYMNDMKLAQYFQSVGTVFSNMAQGEYRMYQFHSGQMPGMGQPQGAGQMPGMGLPTGPQAPGLGQPIGAGHGPGL